MDDEFETPDESRLAAQAEALLRKNGFVQEKRGPHYVGLWRFGGEGPVYTTGEALSRVKTGLGKQSQKEGTELK